jgi:hypothetical protein
VDNWKKFGGTFSFSNCRIKELDNGIINSLSVIFVECTRNVIISRYDKFLQNGSLPNCSSPWVNQFLKINYSDDSHSCSLEDEQSVYTFMMEMLNTLIIKPFQQCLYPCKLISYKTHFRHDYYSMV